MPQELFSRGVRTLLHNLDRYDLGFWSLYEQSGTRLPMVASRVLSPVAHRAATHHASPDRKKGKKFARVADRWESYATAASTAPEPSATKAHSNSVTTRVRVKILYVSQYFPPEMGAPSARASELAQHWARAGHEVSVLTGFPNHPTGSCSRGMARPLEAADYKKN